MTKIESGRSMVEMLGVLAIIGVLSIGGIAGYTTAMNRYRANEILDMAAKVSIIGMTKSTDAYMTTDLGVTGNLHGVTNMTGITNGQVTVDGTIAEGVAKAIQSIAGNKTNLDGQTISGNVSSFTFTPSSN